MRSNFTFMAIIATCVGIAVRLAASIVIAVPQNGPSIVVEGDSADFGTAWSSPRFQRTLRIKNITLQSVEIAKIMSNCHCTVVGILDRIIPPNATIDIPITLNLERSGDDLPHFGGREFESGLQIILTDQSEVLQCTIRGHVEPNPLRQIPASVYLGEWLPSDVPVPIQRQFTVDPRCIQIRVVEILPKSIEVAVLQSDDRVVFSFTPIAGWHRGNHQIAVDVEATMPGSMLPARKRIWCHGRVTQMVECVPSTFLISSVELGDVHRESLTIYSTSGTPFRIEKIESSDDSITAKLTSDDFATEQKLFVEVSPSIAGSYFGRLNFVILAEDRERGETTAEVHFIAASSAGISQ